MLNIGHKFAEPAVVVLEDLVHDPEHSADEAATHLSGGTTEHGEGGAEKTTAMGNMDSPIARTSERGGSRGGDGPTAAEGRGKRPPS
jgi:hypothetical protein